MRRSSTLNVLWLVSFLGLFIGVLWYVGPARVIQTLQSATPMFLVAAFACYASFFVLRGLRWRQLLRPIAPRATAREAAALTAGGWMISTFVPFKAGDLARMALMARRHKAGVVAVSGSVAIERALDVIGLAVAASGGLLLASLFAEQLPDTIARAIVIAWILPLLGLGVLFLVARWIPARNEENVIIRFAHRFLTAVQALRQNPRRLPALLLLSLLITSCQVGVFAFLFQALRPGAPWVPILAGAPLFLLSFIISITPGHVGTYEAAFVFVFYMMGFRNDLGAMAVACHILTISFVTLLGTLGMLSYRLRVSDAVGAPVLEKRPEAEVDA